MMRIASAHAEIQARKYERSEGNVCRNSSAQKEIRRLLRKYQHSEKNACRIPALRRKYERSEGNMSAQKGGQALSEEIEHFGRFGRKSKRFRFLFLRGLNASKNVEFNDKNCIFGQSYSISG